MAFCDENSVLIANDKKIQSRTAQKNLSNAMDSNVLALAASEGHLFWGARISSGCDTNYFSQKIIIRQKQGESDGNALPDKECKRQRF